MTLALPARSSDTIPQAITHCDDCGSCMFVQKSDGYLVCTDCGLEHNEIPLVNKDHQSRDGEFLVTHIPISPLGTRVGYPAELEKERGSLHGATRWCKKIAWEETIKIDSEVLIRKYLSQVGLEEQLGVRDCACDWFKRLRVAVPRNSRARNVDVMCLVAVYRACEENKIAISWHRLNATCLHARSQDKACRKLLLASASLIKEKRISLARRIRPIIEHLVSEANLSRKVATAANYLAGTHLKSFKASKPRVQVAAMIVAAATCVGERCHVKSIADIVGVSASAVTRCLNKVIHQKKGSQSEEIPLKEIRKRLVTAFPAISNLTPMVHFPGAPGISKSKIQRDCSKVCRKNNIITGATMGASSAGSKLVTPSILSIRVRTSGRKATQAYSGGVEGPPCVKT